MLAAGCLIGWYAKTANPEAGPVPPATGTSLPKHSSPEGIKPTAETKRPERPRPEPVEKSGFASKIEGQDGVEKALLKRLGGGLAQHMEKLSVALDLTEAQRASLGSWLEGGVKSLGSAASGDPKAAEELMKKLTPKALEEQLLSGLTPEQKTALEEFRTKEHRSKVDAAALKSLSKIQSTIDLAEGQRDDVYRILAENADTDLKAMQDGSDPTSMVAEEFGLDLDPYGLGIGKLLEDVGAEITANGENADTGKVKQRVLEAFGKRVEERVDRLRPVLNETQIERYRSELQAQGMGVLGVWSSSP